MKKSSTLAGILCVAALFFAGVSVNADEQKTDKADEYKFEVISEQDKTCKITSGKSYHDVYTIPAKSPEGYKVVSIGDYAFVYSGIKELVIPEGIETIGEGALYQCQDLVKVQFPKTLKTIEKQAFYECYYLEEVTLYDGLETIGEEAFWGCVSCLKFTFPGTLKSVGKSQFVYDGQKVDLYYDGTIEDYYSLFPNSYYLRYFITAHCSKIATPTPTNTPRPTNTPMPTATPEPTETPVPTMAPATPTPEITRQVLPGPIGRTVMVNPDFLTANGNIYKINKKKEAILIGSNNKGNIVIPDQIITLYNTYKVTGIADDAFKNVKTIKSITIGANVKSIGKEAFRSCKKLKKITIRSVKLKPGKIGKDAFKDIYKKAVFKVPKKYKKAYKKTIKKMLKGAKIS